MKLIEITVLIEAPGPIGDEEGEAFLNYFDIKLALAIDAAARGVLDAAKTDKVPLADVARLTVSD